jgi:hypothetical protein
MSHVTGRNVIAGVGLCLAASFALSGCTKSTSIVVPSEISGPIRGLTAAGNSVWVVNQFDGNHFNRGSVTQLNAATGKLVRVIHGDKFAFNGPGGILSDGTNVWVADYASLRWNTNTGNYLGALTEFTVASGHLERVIFTGNTAFSGPTSIVESDGRLWIGNDIGSVGCSEGGTVTEIVAATSKVVKFEASCVDKFSGIDQLAVADGHVFVQNGLGSIDYGVTVLNSNTASLFKIEPLKPSDKGFNCAPGGIAATSGFVWAAYQDCFPNYYGSAIQWNARTGKEVRAISIADGGSNSINAIRGPSAVAAVDNTVWIAFTSGGSTGSGEVTELNATTGQVIRKIGQPKYRFNDPEYLAISDGHVWVANNGSNTVTELSVATGKLIRVIS